MSSKPILLAITAGISDLQPIVLTDDGRRCRTDIKRNNRLFHESLLAGMPGAHISVDESDETLPELKLELPGAEGNSSQSFDPDSPLWLDREQQHCAEFEREGDDLVLVAPKLGHVWRWLKETGTPLASVLVFTTRRDADFRNFGREEPVALGPLLTAWFQPLCREPADLRTVEYLQGHEILEDLQRGGNLSFAAARRIESGLWQMHVAHPNAPLMLAISGGQPAVKEFVAAAARLFFPPERIRSALRTATGTDSCVAARPGPAEAARVRRIALWHVRHGGFVEAHGVALEFHDDPDAAAWVRPLGYAADLINRNLAVRDDPHIRPPKSLRHIAERQGFRCLIPALRAEAALQGGHTPEAINWTLSFFDAILLDAIEKSLPSGARLRDRERLIVWPAGLQPDAALLLGTYPALKDMKRDKYEYDAVGRAAEQWFSWIGSAALQALRQAILAGQPSPLAYRNINTHNRLTKQELEEACNTFRRTGLWAEKLDGPGSAFLNQPVVQGALSWLLGDSDPAGLYRALVEDLERLLLVPEGVSTLPPARSPAFVVA
jgi:hypothetical protein